MLNAGRVDAIKYKINNEFPISYSISVCSKIFRLLEKYNVLLKVSS